MIVENKRVGARTEQTVLHSLGRPDKLLESGELDAAMGKVLADGGAFEEVFPKTRGSKAPSPLKVKEVRVGGRRYLVCFNENQATKDRHDREAIVAALQDALKQGDFEMLLCLIS